VKKSTLLNLNGQYSLKRVLTLPNGGVTVANLGELVSLDSDGGVVAAVAGALFFGKLKTVTSDGFVTVDFSGVVKVTASAAIAAGTAVLPSGSNQVTAAAAAGDVVSALFLN